MAVIGLILGLVCHANASDWRFGIGAGAGGAGLSTSTKVSGALRKVDRNEGPLIVSIFGDRLLSDSWSIGFEHTRGVRLGPAASGISFTGLTHRWYWFGQAPSVPATNEGSFILVRRLTPFVALGYGVAVANVQRDNDLVEQLNGSGFYVGAKVGADYPLAPGQGIRPEFSSGTTVLSQGEVQTDITLVSIGVSWYWLL